MADPLSSQLGVGLLVNWTDRASVWVLKKLHEKIRGGKPTPNELEAFFQSGLDERKAKNLLEGLANDLIKGLEPRFKESGLTEDDLIPVNVCIETILEKLDISPELVSQYSYDSNALSQYAESLATNDLLQGLSDSQIKLVREILRHLGMGLLRIGFDLPHSISDLLQRFSELQNTIAIINVQSRRTQEIAERLNPDRYIAAFEEHYRVSLAEKLDEMELLGLDHARRSLRRYPLQQAFVHLRIEASGQQLKIEDALIRHRRVLLKGVAGSGKTTLLRWLSVMVARGQFGQGFRNLNGKFPILITLRDYNDFDKPLPETLADLLPAFPFRPPISDEHLEEFLHRRLEDGNALILVDGVDEVLKDRVRTIRKWIGDLIRAYPKASYIVSSRPVVSLADWLQLKGREGSFIEFAEAKVESLSDTELESLVSTWHDVAAAKEGDLGIHSLSKRLLADISGHPGLRDLASTPLLASAMCALNLNSPGGLSKVRQQLYRDLVEMLLQRRDQARNISDPAADLPIEAKILLLASIADRIVEFSGVSIEGEAMRAVLTNRLLMASRQTNMEQVFLSFVERSGLLRQVAEDRYEFIHKSFQEYLAALHLVRENVFEVAAMYLLSDQDELSYFMAVVAPSPGPVIRSMLSELVLTSPSYIDHEQAMLYVARCVEDCVAIDIDDQIEILKLFRRWKKRHSRAIGHYELIEEIEKRFSTKIDLTYRLFPDISLKDEIKRYETLDKLDKSQLTPRRRRT